MTNWGSPWLRKPAAKDMPFQCPAATTGRACCRCIAALKQRIHAAQVVIIIGYYMQIVAAQCRSNQVEFSNGLGRLRQLSAPRGKIISLKMIQAKLNC